MNIAVLGTGMVGNAIGSRLVELGHQVMMGSRSANNEKATTWAQSTGSGARTGTFAEAAHFGEVIFNCTKGIASLDALEMAGAHSLKEKILVDVSNPLDFSKGMPPSLSVVNTDSLAESIQRAYPDLKVVKTLNTMNCYLMVNPALLAGDHTVFMSGNDDKAKATIKELLNTFGWKDKNIIDLGDITTARGTEQLLPIWVRLYGKLQNPMFNFNIVMGQPQQA